MQSTPITRVIGALLLALSLLVTLTQPVSAAEPGPSLVSASETESPPPVTPGPQCAAEEDPQIVVLGTPEIVLATTATLPCTNAVFDCETIECIIDTLGLTGCLTDECIVAYFWQFHGVVLVICDVPPGELTAPGHGSDTPDAADSRECTMIVFSVVYDDADATRTQAKTSLPTKSNPAGKTLAAMKSIPPGK